jgi:hypothetical protein
MVCAAVLQAHTKAGLADKEAAAVLQLHACLQDASNCLRGSPPAPGSPVMQQQQQPQQQQQQQPHHQQQQLSKPPPGHQQQQQQQQHHQHHHQPPHIGHSLEQHQHQQLQ